MNDEQYQLTQDKIIEIGKLARQVNATGFIDRISAAETLGPVVDPTKYRAAMRRLVHLKEMARLVDMIGDEANALTTTVLDEEVAKL